MTTRVKIEHLGPEFHKIIVCTQNPSANGEWEIKSIYPIEMGETVEVHVYDTQRLTVREI